MRRQFPAYTGIILFLASLVFNGCSDSGTGPEGFDVVFPLQVGNVWTYAPDNPLLADAFQWKVLERTADTVTLSPPHGDLYTGNITVLDGQDILQIILNEETTRPFYRFHFGGSWIHYTPWECDDESEWVALEEEEPIDTPAGTFHNTIRLERRSTATCTDAGTMVEWWAPGVGLVRWEELNFWAGGTLTFELVDYEGSV